LSPQSSHGYLFPDIRRDGMQLYAFAQTHQVPANLIAGLPPVIRVARHGSLPQPGGNPRAAWAVLRGYIAGLFLPASLKESGPQEVDTQRDQTP
jgi:hypothetical protein